MGLLCYNSLDSGGYLVCELHGLFRVENTLLDDVFKEVRLREAVDRLHQVHDLQFII